MSYQQLFDEAIGAAPPSSVDVDRVVRRERRAKVLRPVLAAVAAVLVIAAGATGAVMVTGNNQAVPPADDPLDGFPEYYEGHRVVSARMALFSDRTVTLPFTAGSSGFALLTRCDRSEISDDIRIAMTYEVGTGAFSESGSGYDLCPPEQGGFSVLTRAPDEFPEFPAGAPMTATVTLDQARDISTGAVVDLPDQGWLALAVAVPVPFEDYAFPPRPATLTPLPEPAHPGVVSLTPDPDNPAAPVTTNFRWNAADLRGCPGDDQGFPSRDDDYLLALVANTPGSLRVLVNGVEVAHEQWWSYQPITFGANVAYQSWEVACLEISRGALVRVTVEPSGMTGDWRVVVYQHP